MEQQPVHAKAAISTRQPVGDNKKSHPGVYIPPPLIYAGFYLVSIFVGKLFPFDQGWLHSTFARVFGWLLVAMFLLIACMAIRQFVKSKNTLVTIKPASTLQTDGIYGVTRNPMYLSLLLLYTGVGILKGNCWTLIFVPFLILVVQLYVIRKEERYLRGRFGASYDAYQKKVNRWI